MKTGEKLQVARYLIWAAHHKIKGVARGIRDEDFMDRFILDIERLLQTVKDLKDDFINENNKL